MSVRLSTFVSERSLDGAALAQLFVDAASFPETPVSISVKHVGLTDT